MLYTVLTPAFCRMACAVCVIVSWESDSPGYAEIHHLHVAGPGQDHVARLDVAVHDAVAMAVVQHPQHTVSNLGSPLRRQPPAVAEQIAQRAVAEEVEPFVGDLELHLGLLLLAGLSVFIALRKRSRASWYSFAFAFATMLVVFASAAVFEVYRFRDYPDYERYPALVRNGVPGFLKWYITSFQFPRRPNQALERTADRRDNLLSMTSTLESEPELAIVSGRSAPSR